MQIITPTAVAAQAAADRSIGRIVSVTGSKAIVMLDRETGGQNRLRPEMGILLAIEQPRTIALAIVSALSVPVPAAREGEREIWIAELGLAGEIRKKPDGSLGSFFRGVSSYPALGDRVRLASKVELAAAFGGERVNTARVGTIHQDPSIPAVVCIDDLLGKHFAVLGTTGTGKSCTTALMLRSIIDKSPNAHIVLLDPHNEYATAFTDKAEVIAPRNMQLPFWLLTFEEIVEVLIGDSTGRKAEVEILQELIPLCKARNHTAKAAKDVGLRRSSSIDNPRYSVDTPVPYRISDLLQLIDDRMGRLENRKELQPYRALKYRIDTIGQDPRYAFMFGSVTIVDGMSQILGRIFRVPVNDKPISIIELTGLPTEVVSVVVSVVCRMAFDFAMWSDSQVPVLLVCEEAHRYVPSTPNTGFEPCKRAIAKIAKEGRKYGTSLCVVSQRPAEIDPTILSQCNTIFALRMSNDRDQQIVQAALTDTGSGLLEFLPALGQREAIGFGDGISLPVRITFDALPASCLPRSSTAKFSEKWQSAVDEPHFLDQIVERWRVSGGAFDAGQFLNLNPDSIGTAVQANAAPSHLPDLDTTASLDHDLVTAGLKPSSAQQRPAAPPDHARSRRSRRPRPVHGTAGVGADRRRRQHRSRRADAGAARTVAAPASTLNGDCSGQSWCGRSHSELIRCASCVSARLAGRETHEHPSSRSFGRIGHAAVASVAVDVPQAVHPVFPR